MPFYKYNKSVNGAKNMQIISVAGKNYRNYFIAESIFLGKLSM